MFFNNKRNIKTNHSCYFCASYSDGKCKKDLFGSVLDFEGKDREYIDGLYLLRKNDCKSWNENINDQELREVLLLKKKFLEVMLSDLQI